MDKEKMNDATNEVMDDEIFDNNEDESEYIRTCDARDNSIEWYTGNKIVTITLTQRKLVNKVLALAKKYPNEVSIEKHYEDGTLYGHLPLSYIKIQRPREMTPEEKEVARDRLQKYWKRKE